MLFSLFTILYDGAQDPEFVDIFEKEYRPYSPYKESSRSFNPNFHEFLVANLPKPTSKHIALQHIQELFREMEKEPITTNNQVFNLTARNLTPKGAKLLQQFIIKKLKEKEKELELAKEFLSFEGVELDSSFSDLPTHRVEVTEILNTRAGVKEQRVRFDLVNRITGDKTEIQFPNNDCRIIYLWFLMHPRQMILKASMLKQFTQEGEFAQLAKYLLNNPSEFMKKVEAYQENPQEPGRKNGFEQFFTQNLCKVNSAVKEALKDLQIDERWYLIGKEPEGYSISLTEEYIKLISTHLQNLYLRR